MGGNGRLPDEAVLLGVWGVSAPEVPLRLPTLERSNAARVGVTPSSCSRMPGMSPVLPSVDAMEVAYTLDSETEPSLVRRPVGATEEVE